MFEYTPTPPSNFFPSSHLSGLKLSASSPQTFLDLLIADTEMKRVVPCGTITSLMVEEPLRALMGVLSGTSSSAEQVRMVAGTGDSRRRISRFTIGSATSSVSERGRTGRTYHDGVQIRQRLQLVHAGLLPALLDSCSARLSDFGAKACLHLRLGR